MSILVLLIGYIMTNNEQSGWAIFKRLASYVKEFKLGLIGAIIGMLGYAAVDATFVYSIQPLIDKGLTGKDPSILTFMPIFVILIVALRGVAAFLSSYGMAWVGSHIVMKLQRQLFEKLMALPISFFDKTNTGDLLSKITYDANQVSNAASNALVKIFREGATAIAFIGMMFYLSWQLSLVFFVIAPIVAVAVSIVSKRFRKISKNIQNAMGMVTTSSEQMLKGHKEVLMFGGQNIEKGKFDKVSNTVRAQNMKMTSANAISVPIIQTIASFALAFVLYLATYPQIMDTLTPGKFTVIITYLMMLMKPLKAITQINADIQRGISASASLFGILDLTNAKDDGKDEIVKAKGDLTLNNVVFTYPTADQAALNDVSFSVKQGEIVGFLGPNGAGKSTMMKIITCFLPKSEGEVRVCGLDVVNDSLEVRKIIGYLPEHNPLYLDMYIKEYLDFVAGIYKIKNKKERIAEMIALVGLEKEQNKKIGALS